jgi:hypothetical protein
MGAAFLQRECGPQSLSRFFRALRESLRQLQPHVYADLLSVPTLPAQVLRLRLQLAFVVPAIELPQHADFLPLRVACLLHSDPNTQTPHD